eukprot:gene3419-3910_t
MERRKPKPTNRASLLDFSSQNNLTVLMGMQTSDDSSNDNDEMASSMAASRAAATYFDKYDRDELQEALSSTSLDWLLSSDDTKLQVEPPTGIISNMIDVNEVKNLILLIPAPDNVNKPLELREMHQLLRELVTGVYVLNQTPSMSLETNFDQSTSCQMSACYHDTRIGQLMIEVDYMIKSIWHGSYFPTDKRLKFNERWRQSVNLNTLSGEAETRRSHQLIWNEAGLMDLATDGNFKEAFEKLAVELKNDPCHAEEKRFFMKHVNDLAMVLTFEQKSLKCYKNMFVLDAETYLTSIMRNPNLDLKGFERLQRMLSLQEQFTKENLENKDSTRRALMLLKFVSFLVPLLIALKKRNKIPDVNKLLPALTHEECKTDREFPPIVIGENFVCKNFDATQYYHSLHGGIQMLRETPSEYQKPSLLIQEEYYNIVEAEKTSLAKVSRAGPMLDSYPLTPITIDDKKYYVFSFEIETYYPVTPKIPRTVHAHYEEIAKLKPKRLPLTEIQIHEQFRKRYGYQRTVKLKQVPAGLKAAAQRGLVAVFHTICRRQTTTTLVSQDSQGISLLHHAAAMNRPHIITQLVMMGLDINVRRFNNASELGIMPIHLATRCGANESVAALVAFKADLFALDALGFTGLHYAAYFNNVTCMRILLNKEYSLLELKSNDKAKATPLLLASSSGAIHALIFLIDSGADLSAVNSEGNGVVSIAVLHEHTHILKYFIVAEFSSAPVWEVLVSMLNTADVFYQYQASKCLEALTIDNKMHWEAIVKANGIKALVALLDTDDVPLLSMVLSVLCNIGEFDEVRREISVDNAVSLLVALLDCPVSIVHSRAAVLIGDLGCIAANQKIIADQGAVEKLVKLLSSDVEHVLVNVVNALRVLADKTSENQSAIGSHGAISIIIDLLGSNSIRLQANTAACVSAMAFENKPNQDMFVNEGAVKPLVKLLKSKDSRCQLKAASALQTLAEDNQFAQEEIDKCDAAKPLIRLLKLWAVNMKEQGATALWALAGETIDNQKRIAELIGINILVDMLMTKSEKLQYVAGMAITALGKEDMKNQNRISEGGGIMPLVRILRTTNPPTSEKVLIMAIQVLGNLCVGVAHQPNRPMQKEIAGTEALSLLVNFMQNHGNLLIKVEAAMTLAKIALSNPCTQQELANQRSFSIINILDLLRIKDLNIRLRAATALSTFAYNNINQQLEIRACGGVMMKSLECFLKSDNERLRAFGAFHIIILARVVVDVDQVTLSARGVEMLVGLLKSDIDDTKVLTASLLASLAHTRAGITDAMVVAGTVDSLIENLHSANKQVRGSTAVALGYLSFNSTASRLLLSACRNTPGLYDSLQSNLGNGKLSMAFVQEWKRNLLIGLPCNSLVINGGPPIPTKEFPHRRQRPKTTQSLPVLSKPKRDPKFVRASSFAHFEKRPITAASFGNASSENIYALKSTKKSSKLSLQKIK